jgi:hypothetical protein
MASVPAASARLHRPRSPRKAPHDEAPLGAQTAIDRSARPTSIPLKATKIADAPNQKVTLTGFLKSGHHPVVNAPVTLESRQAGSRTFTVVSAKTTDSNGKVTLIVAHQKTTGSHALTGSGDVG